VKEKQKRKKQSTDTLKAALIDSEEKLLTIIDSLPDGIVIVDMDLKVLGANEAAARIAGLTRKEDLIGRKGLDFISPKHMDQIAESLLGALAGRPEERVQFSIVDASGKEVDIELSVSKINDSSGNQTGFVVIGRDISERKHVEEALKESESRYRELFEHMSSGVVVYEAINDGQDFIFKDFNSVAERISRLSREDLIGKSVLETKPGLKKFGLFDVLQKVWKTGKPEYMPVSYYEDEFVSGWRENFTYKLPSGEVVAVYNDITERKKAEDAFHF
jgi:PAS domain S-box-containing protein